MKSGKIFAGIGVALLMCFQTVSAVSYFPDVITRDLDLKAIPGPYRFESVCLTDKNELWSVGGGGEVQYFQVDTGKSVIHKLENKSLFNGGFYGVFCGNKGDVRVVGNNGVIFYTTDNGKNWELQKIDLEKDVNLNAVTCTDEKCWTVGDYGTLLSSDNKAGKLEKIDIKASEKEDLKDIFFINDQIGWIIGGSGGLWKTIDGGKNWAFQKLMFEEESAHSLAVKFYDAENGWISGFDFVARTEDGGKNWQFTELDGQIIGIVTQDGKKVWAIKRGGNYCSSDSGKIWNECGEKKSKAK